jgi:hypothetical protein
MALSQEDKVREKSKSNTFTEFAIGMPGHLAALGGIFLFAYQSYQWLKYGAWESYSLLDGLIMCCGSFFSSGFCRWILEPQDWVGLHKLFAGFLDWIPLSLFLIILGLTAFVRSGLYDSMERAYH